jgi:uncharacterized protein
MKLHLEQGGHRLQFTGYGPGWVAINGQRYATGLLLTPERVVQPWQAVDVDTLTMADFGAIAEFRPDIVLLGTGPKFRMPTAPLMRVFNAEGIGLETMDTHAACRTYNVLLSEGRQVAAALLAL